MKVDAPRPLSETGVSIIIPTLNGGQAFIACLEGIEKPVRVAVMGCVVNGPGEAADADIAICAGAGKGYIYKNGKKIACVEESKLLDALAKEIKRF